MMSDALYNSLQRKWRDYLDEEFSPFSPEITSDEATEHYDELAHDFCKKHGYSEKTEEMAFHKSWYDTFADEFYLRLEREGIKIVHSSDFISR